MQLPSAGFRGVGETTAVSFLGEETLVNVSVDYSGQHSSAPAWYESASTVKGSEFERVASDAGSTERPMQLDAMNQQ